MTDHFPIVISLKNDGASQQHSKSKHKYKRSYNEENIKASNHRLLSINWDEIKNCDDPNVAYKQFCHISNSIYDIYFPKVLVRLKTKHIQSLWITKWIAKSSKRKQKLYKKILKHRARETALTYKSYKFLFESLKKKAKKKYYRSSHQRCSVKKGVLRNFAKFTGKHLYQSLFFNKIAG